MGLVDTVKEIVSPAPKLTHEQLRKARPERNPLVECQTLDDGGLVLTAPLELQGRGILAWIAKRMNTPNTKSFELEPVGAFVWELCDGGHTCDMIAKRLRERYKMNRLEADAALTAFLQMLGQRRLISLKMGKKK